MTSRGILNWGVCGLNRQLSLRLIHVAFGIGRIMTDKDIKTAPVVGWDTLNVAQTTVLLRLHHVTTEDQLRGFYAGTAEASHINAMLTPKQAMDLAADLQNAAKMILAQQTPLRSHQS
jgi:hypothetical protein